MTPSQRSSKPRFALAAAVAGASLLLGIAEARGAPATPRMNFAMEEIQEPLDPATVHFGEVIFDYYTGRNLDAVTKLLIARERRILSESEDYAEMLLGDLYTSFGLIDSAERIFAGLVNRDILPSTRNETWFHTAELRYHQGQLDEAARILEGRIDELPPKLEKSRLIILGNIYMSRGEFERAAELLGTVKGDDILGAYALYNAGVALIRADQVDRGMPFLVQFQHALLQRLEIPVGSPRRVSRVADRQQGKGNDKERQQAGKVRHYFSCPCSAGRRRDAPVRVAVDGTGRHPGSGWGDSARV